MSLFAKDLDYLEVVAADFLPDNNKLFIIVADSDCNIYVLQYDPEGETSLRIHTQLVGQSAATNST
jgi:cleavage and polyadenylation specificity factor subunit 1